MKNIFIICFLISLVSCNNEKQNSVAGKATTSDSQVVVGKGHSEPKADLAPLPIVDTGQTWFRVYITKNDSVFMDYEGSWPIFFLSNNSATLQLSKSKQIMGITEILTIYMNGMPTGPAPILASNRDKGTVSMIMSPVEDGAYGLPIWPSEGTFNLTKNVDSIVSGNFQGKGLDINTNDEYVFKGYFLNTRINPDKI